MKKSTSATGLRKNLRQKGRSKSGSENTCLKHLKIKYLEHLHLDVSSTKKFTSI
jgi:hypothetical protein